MVLIGCECVLRGYEVDVVLDCMVLDCMVLDWQLKRNHDLI